MSTDILRLIHDRAARGDDLAVALAASGLPAAAERLRRGETLPQALAGVLPPALLSQLGGGNPPLVVRAALLLNERARSRERRRLLAMHLSYPLAVLSMVGGMAVIIQLLLPPVVGYGHRLTWWYALPPAMLAVVMMLAPFLPARFYLPGSGWIRHLDRATRWSRAGLAAQWRLTEADAERLLGVDLAPFQAVLAAPGAAEHCRTIAAWHHHAAVRRLAWTARAAAGLVLLTGGGVVLANLRVWIGGI